MKHKNLLKTARMLLVMMMFVSPSTARAQGASGNENPGQGQTTVTAGKDVKAIGVKAATEGAQETVTEIDEEGQAVPAAVGSTVRVIGNAPEEGKAARLKLTIYKAPESEVVKVQTIEVKGKSSVKVGKSIRMKSAIMPIDADNKKVTWSVQDYDKTKNAPLGTNKRATINIKGMLTGKKAGYVMVTAMAQDGSNVAGSMIVHVIGTTASNVTISGFEPIEPEEDEWRDLRTVADTEETKAIKEELQKAAESGDVLSALPDDVKAELGEEFNKVDEMVTVKIEEGLDAKKGLKCKKRLQTPLKNGANPRCLFAIPGADGRVEWIVVTSVVNEDNDICMTLDEAVYNKIAGKEIVLVPVMR